jgi:hypothetical protein
MEPLLCFPDPPRPELAKALDSAGYAFIAVADAEAVGALEPPEGWSGAVVSTTESPEAAFRLCDALRRRDEPVAPILLVVEAGQLGALDGHLLWRTGRGKHHDVIAYGPLALNLETYQAVVAGRSLDLTFMEYELLRFLAAHPGKVFTRETLLARVWGYEYFGGARTVDVHIRRLRAKLGEENAHLIETVRSVGYRFGTARWRP